MKTSASSSTAGKIARTLASVLGRSLAFLIAIILCLPIVLLITATAVPALVWIALAADAAALLVVQFRLKPAWRGIVVSLIGLLVVSFSAVLASQFFATTPPIAAAELFARNFKQLRMAVPALPDRWENPETIASKLDDLFQRSPGVIAVEDDRLLGYLGWFHRRSLSGNQAPGSLCARMGARHPRRAQARDLSGVVSRRRRTMAGRRVRCARHHSAGS